MNTSEFFELVLPSQGTYSLATRQPNGKNFQHEWYETVEDIALATDAAEARGREVYYAIAGYSKEERKQSYAEYFRVIAYDIDAGAGKPYADYKEAVAALAGFVDKTDLPVPYMVRSGGGIHAYWVLDRDLPRQAWSAIASSMKKLAQDSGLEIDPVVTSDAARILRPVGTVNHKHGKTTSMFFEGAPISPEDLIARLPQKSVSPPVGSQPTRKNTSSKGQQLMQDAMAGNDLPLAKATLVEKRCLQIADAVTNQSKVSEPLWYKLIGAAAFTTDPEETAKRWSEKDTARYDEAHTLGKLTQWQETVSGPPTCESFNTERPGICQGCKFFNKISTPIQVGVEREKVEAAPEVKALTTDDVPMPRGYKRTADGIFMQQDEDIEVEVCPFDIYPISYGHDEALGYEVVRFKWNRRHEGWSDLTFRQAYLTDSKFTEFATDLADSGIVLVGGSPQTKRVQWMLRAYMENLRKVKKMANLYANMGWKGVDKDTFVVGDMIIRRADDGNISADSTDLSAATTSAAEQYYQMGDHEQQVSATTLVNTLDMPELGAAYIISLASPFMWLTGLKGAIVSYKGETGSGKTLCQYAAQSMWGNPTKLHMASRFTENSVYTRMATSCNLPVTIDEVTMVEDRTLKDLAYSVSQGRDKARLDANAMERKPREWELLVFVSTNRPLLSKFQTAGLDAQAQQARVLEIDVPRRDAFTDSSEVGRTLYKLFTEHFGHIGPEFIKYMMGFTQEQHTAGYERHIHKLRDEYGADLKGHERYTEGVIGLISYVGERAEQSGLIKFDHTMAVRCLLTALDENRDAIEDSAISEYDLLWDYVNQYSRNQVVVTYTKKDAAPPIVAEEHTLRKDPIHVRFELERDKVSDQAAHGRLIINRAHFNAWLVEKGTDATQVTKRFREDGALATINKSGKYTIGKDIDTVRGGQIKVLSLALPHPELRHVLDEANDGAIVLGAAPSVVPISEATH